MPVRIDKVPSKDGMAFVMDRRSYRMALLWLSGSTKKTIAATFGITRGRTARILSHLNGLVRMDGKRIYQKRAK